MAPHPSADGTAWTPSTEWARHALRGNVRSSKGPCRPAGQIRSLPVWITSVARNFHPAAGRWPVLRLKLQASAIDPT
eukprot:CAMPEP_0181488470 /NCGR_PEP_ID=MMETSP1110-20121109/48419_1 /TAXON_ID=174948 /ORGANISM="Symbiodinium sp., Strain CCMP421" /LENGTH=76 /DNA_ID=CAMNT_0023615145 /DNA_START=86 /DNA_END=312 /DNA_ORIENTATION=+